MCWSEKRRWPNKIRIALACGCNSRLLVNRDMKGLARDHCVPFDSVGTKHEAQSQAAPSDYRAAPTMKSDSATGFSEPRAVWKIDDENRD